jgi:hypothetical protein
LESAARRHKTLKWEVNAHQNRQRSSARLNWLLRQLREADPESLFVRIIWPTRAQDVVCPLAALREDTTKIGEDSSQAPRAFELNDNDEGVNDGDDPD